ncbi:MAG: transporter substrate-binding domain-containing protein [Thermodesulfobacteriota bacterium]
MKWLFGLTALLAVVMVAACGLDEQDPLGRQERAWVKEHGPVKVGVHQNYPPFSFLEQDGKPAGICIDLWRFMADKLKFKVQFFPLDMQQQQDDLQAGRLDSLGGIFPLASRKATMDFSAPYYAVSTSIFVNIQTKNVSKLADLAALKVGAVQGDSGQTICAAGGIKPQLFTGYGDAVLALGQGRLQAIVMDEPVVLYYRRKLGLLDKVEWATGRPVVDRNDLALPVKKGNAVLLRILNKGLAAAGGSEMQRIRERWVQ